MRTILPTGCRVNLPIPKYIAEHIFLECRGMGLMKREDSICLFPNGRLRINQGFIWEMPEVFYIERNKVYIPSMVYAALEKFKDIVPYRIRLDIFTQLLKMRNVNSIGIWHLKRKLKIFL